MKPLLLLLLLLSSCRPCRAPDLCMPTLFAEGDMVDVCGDEDVDLLTWWEQFHDPLMSDLIAQGVACNYDLRIARERICEARAIFGIEFSHLLPQIDAIGLFQRMRNSQTIADADFTGGAYTNFYLAGFDAFWEIDLFGKRKDRARAAANEVVAEAEEVRDIHLSIAAEVAKNYIHIRTMQKRIEIAEHHIETESELLVLVKDRFEAGLISQLDVYTAKALLDARLAILPQLQAEFQQAVYSLSVLLGMIPEALIDVFHEQAPIPCAQEKIPLGLPSELLCRRGDVRHAEYMMRAANAHVSAARKEFFPTLSLEGIATFATGFFSQWFKAPSKQWDYAPSLVLPIFHGGAIWSHVQVETSLQHQAVLAYEQSVLVALKEVESSLNAYFKEGERIRALQNEVDAYREAQELARILYFGGMVDFLYVLDTERDLFISENFLAESRGQLMAHLVSIYKALGGGWECCASP